MAEPKTCESCGMPMEDVGLHGGGDINNPYCVHCTTPEGKLKSREEIREGMINFYISQKRSKEEAERIVDETMEKMSAWKK